MRYFFHTTEDGQKTADLEGIDLPDDDAANYQATLYLVEVAAELIPHRGRHLFRVEVQTESGVTLTIIGITTLYEGPDVGL